MRVPETLRVSPSHAIPKSYVLEIAPVRCLLACHLSNLHLTSSLSSFTQCFTKIPSQFNESKHLDCSIDPKVPRDSCHYAPISILRKPMYMKGQCECVQTQSTKPIPATPIASIFHIRQVANRLFVLLLARTLDLCRTSESLLSVLALLA